MRACFLWLWVCHLGLACVEEKALEVDFSEPRAVDGSSTATNALTWFDLEPNSSIDFSLGKKDSQLRGSVPVSTARLALDLNDLSRSQISFSFHTAALVVEPLPASFVSRPRETHESLTRQALQWLQLNNRPDTKTRHTQAEFLVRLIGNGGPYVAGKHQRPKPRKAGSRSRVADLMVTGELSLHGVRIEHTLPVRVTFEYKNSSSSGTPPERIRLQSRNPITLPLRPYGVQPRNSAGDLIASEVASLTKSAFHTARLSFNWTAVAGKPSLK